MRPLLVFDIDGTLSDSRPSIYAAYRHAAETLGLPRPGDGELSEHLCGGLPENIRHLLKIDGDTADRAVVVYREFYARESVGKVPLFKGIRETLAHLHEEGYTMSVATMKVETVASDFVNGLGIGDYFLTVAGDAVEGGRTKDGMIRRCLEEAHLDRAIMIGDCRQDMQGARGAGVPFLAAAYGYGLPVGKCEREGIPYAASPEDIPRMVREMSGE